MLHSLASTRRSAGARRGSVSDLRPNYEPALDLLLMRRRLAAMISQWFSPLFATVRPTSSSLCSSGLTMIRHILTISVSSTLATSCHAPHSFAAGASDSVAVKASADSVIPVGTGLNEAERRLRMQQFACVRSEERISTGAPTLRATYCAGPVVAGRPSRYWLVVLLHDGDTVVATQVRTLERSR